MKRYFLALVAMLLYAGTNAQVLRFGKQEFELFNVTASVVNFKGEQVIRVERDLRALAFDVKNLEKTVDEPTFVRLKNRNFTNGVIEVKVLSQIQNPSPFAAAQGFIGVAFRIKENNSAFESFYLRPRVGRSPNQLARNRTVQYFAYPDHKFDTLRKSAPGMYETSAPVALDEWITLRIEVDGKKAELFVNNSSYSTMIVDPLKGSTTEGSVALWVDIGTIGYFKDLKITTK